MIRSLTPPSAGQPISASFFAELLREVRANRPLQGQNTRLKRTPSGTHISAIAKPAPASSVNLPGCFEIRRGGTKVEDGETTEDGGGFDNPYFMVGGKFYECEDAKDYGVENMKEVFVYVKVDVTADAVEPTMGTAETFSDLQTAARDENVYITPLYKFGKRAGEVEIDFRKMPMAISGEFKQ